MKNNEYGDSVAAVIVNADGELVAQELENGFDKGAMKQFRSILRKRDDVGTGTPGERTGYIFGEKLSARLSSHIILCDGTWRCG